MVREDKVQAVKDLEDLFKSANALVLAEYRGLTVSQQTKLRRSLKNAGASENPLAAGTLIWFRGNIQLLTMLRKIYETYEKNPNDCFSPCYGGM